MTLSETDFHIFSSEVRSVFSGWLSKGYIIAPVTKENTEALGDYFEAVILNSKNGRKLCIILLNTHDGSQHEISVHADNGVESFSVDELLRHRGAASIVIDKLSLRHYAGKLSERIKRCITFVRTVVEEELLSALDGGEWPAVP